MNKRTIRQQEINAALGTVPAPVANLMPCDHVFTEFCSVCGEPMECHCYAVDSFDRKTGKPAANVQVHWCSSQPIDQPSVHDRHEGWKLACEAANPVAV